MPIFQVFDGSRIDVVGFQDDAHQAIAEEMEDAEKQYAEGQHKQGPMFEDHANFLEVALAETSGDEDLYAHGKTHGERGEHEIEQARHHGGAQLVGAEVSQKSRIGEGDDGLCQITQHDRRGDAPYFTVGDARWFHAAKLAIFRIFAA